MPTCKYVTTLKRECGRTAVAEVRWQVLTGESTSRFQALTLCPVHRDFQLVDVVLDCTVGEITVATTQPVPAGA